MEKEFNEKMTYLAIPDEACYKVDVNNGVVFDVDEVGEDTTCVMFIDDEAKYAKEIAELIPTINEHYMKVAWFTKRTSMPFKGELFDYVRVSAHLYMNITEGDSNPRFVDISDKMVINQETLDPISVFYFGMYEEFEWLKKQSGDESETEIESDIKSDSNVNEEQILIKNN